MKINKLNISSAIKLVIALAIGLALGAWLFSSPSTIEAEDGHQHSTAAEVWTCSMHPQIRQGEPGKCPICGMDLIPVETGGEGGMAGVVQLSDAAIKLSQIRTIVVGAAETANGQVISLNGKLQEDERRLVVETAHIPGRVEELKVNFTGEQVRKGQLLARVYSPELVTAQRELLEASAHLESNPSLLEAAKQKLMRWKIGDAQIDEIISSGEVITNFPVYAGTSGVVVNRNVSLGDYVKTGQPLFEVQDLSKLWVIFDAYESDLQWIKKGSTVEFYVPSLPDRQFAASVSYIDPVIDSQRRVARVRAEIGNTSGLLKPEMLVRGSFASLGKQVEEGFLLPKSAVLWTGTRSVVYVKTTTDTGAGFAMREVEIGPSAGDFTSIQSGLVSGDEVVVNGAFTIDAAAQLAGKPSMMNRDARAAPFDHSHSMSLVSQPEQVVQIPKETPDAFRSQLAAFVKAYISLKDALVADKPSDAATRSGQALTVLKAIDMKLLTDNDAHMQWMRLLGRLQTNLSAIAAADDIEKQRVAFIDLSNAAIEAVSVFGLTGLTVHQQHCPMAKSNQGADWLSLEEEIRNPYFGDAMLSCGSVEKTFTPFK